MKLVFYSAVLNHHQAGVADEFYELLGDDYCFVELTACNDQKGAKVDYSMRPYLLKAWKSEEAYNQAMELAQTAEVCVFAGYEALPFEKARLRRGLLSFDMSERLLKKGWHNLLSPRISKMVIAYHIGGWRNKSVYKLSCSAFTASDCRRLGMFEGKCFKWGYFTAVDAKRDIETPVPDVSMSGLPTPLMWCGRFLTLKHPELVVEMARELHSQGYSFTLDIFGDDTNAAAHDKIYPRAKLQKLIDCYGLSNIVKLRGNLPNDKILEQMSRHHIFIFTSDRNEGWGAVANEALSNGCALVAADEIGSTPFLIKDGYNGLIFKSKNLESLTEKVRYLLDNPTLLGEMRQNAVANMQRLWTPRHASESLLQLIANLKKGKDTDITEGPCSKA